MIQQVTPRRDADVRLDAPEFIRFSPGIRVRPIDVLRKKSRNSQRSVIALSTTHCDAIRV